MSINKLRFSFGNKLNLEADTMPGWCFALFVILFFGTCVLALYLIYR